MKGFKDTAAEAGSLVTGGQTVKNPWLTIGSIYFEIRTLKGIRTVYSIFLGGVATSVCKQDQYIMYVFASLSI